MDPETAAKIEKKTSVRTSPCLRLPWHLAVGRLVADPDHEVAEYAVLVADAWQGKGLGGMLTEYCAQIAAGWGVRRLVAETTRDNTRMLAIFRQRGFELSSTPGDSLIKVSKELESSHS